MILRLQVKIKDGEWGTLDTRYSNERDEEVAKVRGELVALQSQWASNYERFVGATFRITQGKK